jgi:hypothetical protein
VRLQVAFAQFGEAEREADALRVLDRRGRGGQQRLGRGDALGARLRRPEQGDHPLGQHPSAGQPRGGDRVRAGRRDQGRLGLAGAGHRLGQHGPRSGRRRRREAGQCVPDVLAQEHGLGETPLVGRVRCRRLPTGRGDTGQVGAQDGRHRHRSGRLQHLPPHPSSHQSVNAHRSS